MPADVVAYEWDRPVRLLAEGRAALSLGGSYEAGPWRKHSTSRRPSSRSTSASRRCPAARMERRRASPGR